MKRLPRVFPSALLLVSSFLTIYSIPSFSEDSSHGSSFSGSSGGGFNGFNPMMMAGAMSGNSQMMMMGGMMGGGGGASAQPSQQFTQDIQQMQDAGNQARSAMSTAVQNLGTQAATQMQNLYSSEAKSQVNLPDETAALQKAATPPDPTKFYNDSNKALSDTLAAINADATTRTQAIMARAPKVPDPPPRLHTPTLASQFKAVHPSNNLLGAAMAATNPKAFVPPAISGNMTNSSGPTHATANASSTIMQSVAMRSPTSNNNKSAFTELEENTYAYPKEVSFQKRQIESR